jgi:hypothetical protein
MAETCLSRTRPGHCSQHWEKGYSDEKDENVPEVTSAKNFTQISK